MSGSFTNGLPASAAALNALQQAALAAQATANATQAAVNSFPTPVPVAGGIMTGLLTLSGDPTATNHAATKHYVDTQLTTSLALTMPLAGGTFTGAVTLAADPASALQPATKQYTDTAVSNAVTSGALGAMPLTGGTFTGPILLSSDPAQSSQAATKHYVDTGDAAALPLAGGTMTGVLNLGAQLLKYDTAGTATVQWDAANSRVVHSGASNYFRFGALGNSFDIKPYNATQAAPNRLSLTVNNTYTTDSAIDATSVTVNHATASAPGALMATRSLRTSYTSTSPNNLLWSDFIGTTSSANNNANSVVAQYVQSVRSAVQTGGTIGCAQWGTVIELRSQTNLPSSQDGALQTLELDMFCGGVDDRTGGPGRTIISMVIGRNVAGDAAPQVNNGITLFPFAGAIGTNASVGRAYSANIPFFQSVFDTRSAAQLTGANAIWMADGHNLAFDTAGTRLLASDTTDGELRYSKSGVPVFAIRDDGSISDNRFRNDLRNPIWRIQKASSGPWTAGTGASVSMADGWTYVATSGGTRTISLVGLSDADRTAIGNNALNWGLSYVFTGGSAASDREVFSQAIPDVRLYAGRTITVSILAKTSSGTLNVGTEIVQNFGTGGSPTPSVNAINGTVQTFTTTWQRLSFQMAVPAITGAVLGTNRDSNQTINFWLNQGSSFSARGGTVSVQSGTLIVADIQVERNLFATAIERRTDDVETSLIYGPQVTSLSGTDDLANAQGLGAATIIRGTINVGRASGVTIGAGQTTAVQTATFTAMQAAINKAASLNKFMECEPGTFEIYGNGGLVFPYGNNLWFEGHRQPTIKQFYANTPGVVIGDATAANIMYGAYVSGLNVQYGVAQTGNTSANAIVIGPQAYGKFSFLTADGGATGNYSYQGIYLPGNGTFFSNTLENINVNGSQKTLLNINNISSGNVWTNVILHQGSTTPAAITGPAMSMGGSGGNGTVFNQLNIEHCLVNQVLSMTGCRDITFNSLHIEDCAGTGASPIIFAINDTSVNINGLDILDHQFLAANTFTGSFLVFSPTLDDPVLINGMLMEWVGSSKVDSDFYLFANNSYGMDFPITANVRNLRVLDKGSGNNIGSHLNFDSNLLKAEYPVNANYTADSYRYGPFYSELIGARLYLTGAFSHYGQSRNAYISYPASLAASCTLTLKNTMRSASPGASVARQVGDTVIVRRATGTASNTLTIANDGGTTLTTNTTAATTLTYVYNGTNFVAVT